MNLCVVTKGTFTNDDYMELYNYFKEDISKYTDAFDMAFVEDGHVISMANVTDQEKFYALFEDQRSKDWNAKFNAKDEAWKLEKIM